MQKLIKTFLPFLLLTFLSVIFFLAFLSQNYIKGTFATDEMVIISSLSPDRPISSIFKDAAWTAQPPLENIVREKIYVPLGKQLGIAQKYPEFFHRMMSLLWWILPIGYFCLNLKDFSGQRKLTIIFAFLLIASTPFMRFYLAEARLYSALAATFTLMVIILLSDRTSYYQIRYKFFFASLLPPLLHLISFPYYLALITFFFYRLFRESFKLHKEHFFDLITLFLLYLIFVIWLYFQIAKVAADFQHPSFNNISLSFINSYLKWTIDWILYGTPFYLFFKVIPNVIKNNILILFGLLAIPSLLLFVHKNFLAAKKVSDVVTLFPIIIMFVWPLTIAAVIFRSSYFSGERYSIAVAVIILVSFANLLSSLLYRIKNYRMHYLSTIFIFILIFSFLFPKIISAKYFNLETAESRFVKENRNLLMDGRNYLILDNGGYSSAVALLAIIYNVPLKTNYIACRYEEVFYSKGQNVFNDWLKQHSKDSVYFLTTGKELEGNNKIIWKSGLEKLYLLISPISKSNLCPGLDTIGECYIRCTKGYGLAPDGRSIPGTATWLGIYRP